VFIEKGNHVLNPCHADLHQTLLDMETKYIELIKWKKLGKAETVFAFEFGKLFAITESN
jgi:hypothetical protein